MENEFYHKEPTFKLAKGNELLRLALPFLGFLIMYIEYMALPSVYPPTYTPMFWDKVIIAAAVFYLALYLASISFVPLRKRLVHNALFIFGVCIFFTVWDYCSLKTGILRMPFIPSPDRVVYGFVTNANDILVGAGVSFARLIRGLIIGFILGIVSGILCGCIHIADYWIAPFLKIIGPVPALAWMPIYANLTGSIAFASVAIIVVGVWFPLTLLISTAIERIDRTLIEHAQVLGASKFFIVRHVLVPATIPAVMDGLFMAFTAAFGALSAAEAAGASEGLALMLSVSSAIGDYGALFAVVFIMIVVFAGMTAILFAVRNRVLRWQKGLISW